ADRVRSAVRAYEWLRQRDPANLAAANNLAWLQLKGLGQADAALRSAAPLRAKEAATDLPPEMLETLGAGDLGVGEDGKAGRLLERAVRVVPTRPGYWTHLAVAQWRLGRRDDARRSLDRAARLRKSPREADEWRRAGELIHG